METNIPRLEMRRVTTRKTNKGHIRDFSIQVRQSEVYGIISTQSFALENLLSVFSSNIPIIQGEMLYMGESVSARTLQTKNNTMSVITGKDYLYPSFSAFDNIFFFDSKYVHGSRQEKQAKCLDFMKRYNIHIDLTRKAMDLTREERKMVEIIRAYMCSSKLIIMYDVFSRIMENFSVQYASLLEDWKKEGVSIIYLSTQLSDTISVCDRISVFNDGQIKATLAVEEAKKNPQRMISLLSGGEPITESTAKNAQSSELFSIISSARDIISTNKDMKKMLQYLADSLKHIKNAANCVIYVIDERDKLVFASEQTEDSVTRLNPDALFDIANEYGDSPIAFDRKDSRFHSCFSNTDGIACIYCFSIFVRYDIKAMIQLAFAKQITMDEKDIQTVSTFCREVKIAIESSLILEHSSLLQESHHRIKNNLQSIIGLIYMQKYKAKKESAIPREDYINGLDSIINRIKSIAAIHDLLSKDRFGWKNIDLAWLTKRILQFYDSAGISFELDMEEIYIPYNRATSFALVINELISNSTKHAFVGIEGEKTICISCNKQQDYLYLRIEDNGVGIEQPFDFKTQSNIGMSIIRSVAQELNADLQFSCINGTRVDMFIPMDTVYRI